jgi:hypothetical protein
MIKTLASGAIEKERGHFHPIFFRMVAHVVSPVVLQLQHLPPVLYCYACEAERDAIVMRIPVNTRGNMSWSSCYAHEQRIPFYRKRNIAGRVGHVVVWSNRPPRMNNAASFFFTNTPGKKDAEDESDDDDVYYFWRRDDSPFKPVVTFLVHAETRGHRTRALPYLTRHGLILPASLDMLATAPGC